MESSDLFWSEDITILFKYDRLSEFFISPSQTKIEKLNSIARFGIYLSIILALYHKNYKYLALCIITFLITYFLYYSSEKFTMIKQNSKTTEPYNYENPEPIKSTINNPFMNRNPLDNPARQPEKDSTEYTPESLEQKAKIEENFAYNLYTQVGDDIYGKENSQRQFYTVPDNGLAPGSHDHAQWLYGSDYTSNCKLNNYACSDNIHEDLRNNRKL